MQRRHVPSAGFTLLEVMLSLSLSALLLGSLAWAIQLNLKATTSGRSDVARAQLARAALERMATDIRSAVWYDPIDPQSLVVPPSVSSLSSNNSSSGAPSGGPGNSGNAPASSSPPRASAGNAAGGGSSSSSISSSMSSGGGRSSSGGGASGGRSMGNAGGGAGGGASNMGSSGQGGSAASSGGTSNSPTDPNATQPPLMPGFFGGTNWLQVDLSRLPRPDQYFTTTMATPGATGMVRPSEIKSVYYYIAGSAQALPPALSNSAGATGANNQGLMRREADRLVTLWQTTGGGGQMTTGQPPEALAPEIEKLEFRYFNGSTYSNLWDSRQYGCLPRAVEIRITLADDDPATDKTPSAVGSPARRSSEQAVYTLLVSIPAWKPPKLQTTDPTTSSSATGSSSPTTGASAGSR